MYTYIIHVCILARVCCVIYMCVWLQECSHFMFYWCMYAYIYYSCMLSRTCMLKSAHAVERENAVIKQCVMFSILPLYIETENVIERENV